MNCPHFQVKVFAHFLVMASAWVFAKVSTIPKNHIKILADKTIELINQFKIHIQLSDIKTTTDNYLKIQKQLNQNTFYQ